MGGKSNGVEVRENSIRLFFVFEGQRQRQTLMVAGKPMAPTPANVKYANRVAQEIRDRIRHGTFSMAEYFPASGQTGSLTVDAQLDTWLDAQRVQPSTKAGYTSAVAFWKNAIGTKPLRALLQSEIQKALAARSDLSGKTINNYVSVLRQALDLAVADRLIDANPVAKVPRAKHQKAPPDRKRSASDVVAVAGWKA